MNYRTLLCWDLSSTLLCPYQWRQRLKRDLVSRFYCLSGGYSVSEKRFNEADSLNLGFKKMRKKKVCKKKKSHSVRFLP